MHLPTIKLTSLALVPMLWSSLASAQDQDAVIEPGKKVEFEYTLSLADGTIVQSNVGADPVEYTQGQNQLLPALEKELLGLHVGDRKKISIPAAEAYGPVDPDAFREVPIGKVPEEARQAGVELRIQGYDGPVRVHEVKTDTVVLDFNHPLAGKDLNFDIRILSIQ
jgi:FKBP-type peptidyl-prolyl cis-trans isomerase 2